jgi:hypothetical protein
MYSYPDHPSPEGQADPSRDSATPESCVLALYSLISGAADVPRNWDRFRALCRPDARFLLATVGPDGAPLTLVFDVDRFAADGAAEFAKRGLWERALVQRVERFGRIAHVFSAYETRVDHPDAPVVARGVNSVQLVNDVVHGWQIAMLVWDRAADSQPLPADLGGALALGADA